jgi:hypothetical protein
VFEAFLANDADECVVALAVNRSIIEVQSETPQTEKGCDLREHDVASSCGCERDEQVGSVIAGNVFPVAKPQCGELYSVLFWRSSKVAPIHKHVMDSKRCLAYHGGHAEL